LKNAVHAVLAVSLALNLLFGATLLRQERADIVELQLPVKDLSAKPVLGRGSDRPIESKTWAEADIRRLHDDLRRCGLLPEVSRRTIIELISIRYAQQQADLLYPEDVPFWKQGRAFLTKDNRLVHQMLMVEKAADLRAALGRDAIGTAHTPTIVRELAVRYNNAIPIEKYLEVLRVSQDYGYRDLGLTIAGSNGIPVHDIESQRSALLSAQRAEIEKLLNAEELTRFDIVASPAAGIVRREVANIDITEAEFEQLSRARIAYEKKYQSTVNSAVRAQAEEDLTEQRRLILGDARFAQFGSASPPR